MVGFGLSSAAKPVECVFRLRAHSVALTADEQRYALHTIHRHVFFIAGTVSVPLLDLSGGAESALTAAPQKCINSGAKPAYCAAKHINNEAAATNDAVPRARR